MTQEFHNWGNVLNQSAYIEDLGGCQKVLEQRCNILGENHPDTLRTKSNIAFLNIQLGRHIEGLLTYQEVIEKLSDLLEEERVNHAEVIQKLSDLLEEERVNHAQEKQKRVRLEQLAIEGNRPDEQQVAELQRCNGQSTPPMPPPMPPPMLSPPSLSINMSPIPPLAPGAPLLPMQVTNIRKKNVPQPSSPLKGFNWSKLPDTKVEGTIWSNLDDSKWYNKMELETIDELFSTYQKNSVTSHEDMKFKDVKNRTKIVSVIDGRRAQNCVILLHNIKMSDDKISKAIFSMDPNELLTDEMVERLLKFMPSAEERALLGEHSQDIDYLDRADRFLYEISKISDYEKRLNSLLYKKRFMITVKNLSLRITHVKKASEEVFRSSRLKKLLELVLALGNYMNHGTRGNASGFRLSSLNRLADTKSSSSKETTLLHYLVQVCDLQDKDLLKLEEDIPHVRAACKVSLDEMVKNKTELRDGLDNLYRGVPVMIEFHAQSSDRISDLEKQFQEMKMLFDKVIQSFGDDSVVKPDEFFRIFDAFLTEFMNAKRDNDNFKKRAKPKLEAEVKKRTIERKNTEIPMSPVESDPKTDSNDNFLLVRAEVLRRSQGARRANDVQNTSSRRKSFHREESRDRAGQRE